MWQARRASLVLAVLLALPLSAAFRRGDALPQFNGPGMPLVADFNHDGLDDVVNSGHLFLNTGSGFHEAGKLGLPDGVYATQLGDFNGDGIMDLIARGSSVIYPPTVDPQAPPQPSLMAVFLGRGNNVFDAVRGFPQDDIAVFAGDLDGDGKADLVHYQIHRDPNDKVIELSTTVVVERSRGDGTFEKIYEATIAGNSEPQSMTAVDLNNDHRLDLVIRYPSELHVMLSRGATGWEQPMTRYAPLSFGISSILGGDVDGDGNADVVLPGTERVIRVLFGDGRGNFPRSARATVNTSDAMYHEPRNIAAVNYSSTATIDIASSTWEGDVVVFSWNGARLQEIARSATGLSYPYVYAGAFASSVRRDIYALTTFGNDDRFLYAEGRAAEPPITISRSSRTRSVRVSVPVETPLSTMKLGSCVTGRFEQWLLAREGIFGTDTRNGRHIDVVIEDDMMYLRILPNSGEADAVLPAVGPGHYAGSVMFANGCGELAPINWDVRTQ